MLLAKEYSLVADSTISSSPQSDPNTLTYIHRPVRTYGRRRDDDVPTKDLDAPNSSSAPSSASRDSIHNTAPPGLSEEVPPSSPPPVSDCEISMSNADEDGSPLAKFEFSWRKGLRQLDEDDDSYPSTPFASNIGDDASKLEGTNAIVSAPVDDIDVFGGSHSSVNTQPSTRSVSDEVFSLPSPQIKARTRRAKPRVIHDSDSDSEPSKESPSTTPAHALHLLNSPHSGSSSTQPTSEDDMPVKVSTKLPRRMVPLSRTSVTLPEGLSDSEIRSEETRKKKAKIKVSVTCGVVVSLKRSLIIHLGADQKRLAGYDKRTRSTGCSICRSYSKKREKE